MICEMFFFIFQEYNVSLRVVYSFSISSFINLIFTDWYLIKMIKIQDIFISIIDQCDRYMSYKLIGYSTIINVVILKYEIMRFYADLMWWMLLYKRYKFQVQITCQKT